MTIKQIIVTVLKVQMICIRCWRPFHWQKAFRSWIRRQRFWRKMWISKARLVRKCGWRGKRRMELRKMGLVIMVKRQVWRQKDPRQNQRRIKDKVNWREWIRSQLALLVRQNLIKRMSLLRSLNLWLPRTWRRKPLEKKLRHRRVKFRILKIINLIKTNTPKLTKLQNTHTQFRDKGVRDQLVLKHFMKIVNSTTTSLSLVVAQVASRAPVTLPGLVSAWASLTSLCQHQLAPSGDSAARASMSVASQRKWCIMLLHYRSKESSKKKVDGRQTWSKSTIGTNLWAMSNHTFVKSTMATKMTWII